jgi:hypothetical protein
MNAALKITAAAAFAALIGLAAGCSNQAPATYYLDAACPTVVAALPPHPPTTEKQALADEQAVDRIRTKSTMLRFMVAIVGDYLDRLRREIARGGNTSSARVTFDADVSVVKIYCRARSK